MDRQAILSAILDSLPYPVVFVDCDFIIRYMNRMADYHYHTERGYPCLIGRSLLECHNQASREKITAAVEKLKNHGNEVFIGVSVKNQRLYINPVRDEKGELIGFFERCEMNLQK
nr:PAS domain-containing protein [bacterium]